MAAHYLSTKMDHKNNISAGNDKGSENNMSSFSQAEIPQISLPKGGGAIRHIDEAAKRYRYTGVEHDDETGMQYHSARYYLPWLARWLSADPIGIEGGPNLYEYAASNAVMKSDTSGNNPDDGQSVKPEFIRNGGLGDGQGAGSRDEPDARKQVSREVGDQELTGFEKFIANAREGSNLPWVTEGKFEYSIFPTGGKTNKAVGAEGLASAQAVKFTKDGGTAYGWLTIEDNRIGKQGILWSRGRCCFRLFFRRPGGYPARLCGRTD